mgnify:CR=1 FL=1
MEIIQKTTLCYIEKEDSFLFMFRNKKENDYNHGKYIGIGGHFEKGESYIACLKREVKEETGLSLKSYKYLGKVDFVNTNHPAERMYLFKGTLEDGELSECNEGTFVYIKKKSTSLFYFF